MLVIEPQDSNKERPERAMTFLDAWTVINVHRSIKTIKGVQEGHPHRPIPMS